MINLSFLNNAVFITLMVAGIAIWLVGLYAKKNPPKKRNKVYGYRTIQSMKSQEAWDYAQIVGTSRMINSAQIMCFLAIPALFLPLSETIGALIATAIIIALLVMSMVKTEKELKEKFEAEK